MKKAVIIILIVTLLGIISACSSGPADPKDMVLVPAGSFMMGSEKDPAYFHEMPVHNVTLSRDYYMAKYEVTFYEYDTFCNDTGYKKPEDKFWGREKRPVIFVSFIEAVDFCNWKSKQDRLEPCYTKTESNGTVSFTCDFSKKGYRLPTEAEWEYAARGADKSGGFLYAGSNTPDDVAWYKTNSGSKTHPVGEKAPNELGLYDMSGNVWEWCWDLYDADYYKKTAEKDPTGPEKSSRRVIRGGSYVLDPEFERTTARGSLIPESRNYFLGFRIARTK